MLRLIDSVLFNITSIVVILLIADPLSAQVITDPLSLLTITSETMTVKNQERVAIFDQNVIVNKGDLTITADHVKITFNPMAEYHATEKEKVPVLSGSKFNNEVVSELHAWGNVVMQHGTRRAESQEAIYDQKDEKVILLGTPVVFEEGYQISGVKMTIFLKDNSSVVEGSKVLIHPEELRKP